MRNFTVAIFAGCLLALLSLAAWGQQLPKSGSINFHTGFRVSGDALTVAENHMQGHGTAIGVTFNDRGSGPLHGGPATCFYTFSSAGSKQKGYCAFGDADGDRIFTDWHGVSGPDGDHGINEIAGGTGKYAGMQGSGPWKCKPAGANGELHCNQRFDYRLP